MLTFQDLPAPVQLMLLAARTRLTAPEADQIQALNSGTSPFDWDHFLALTRHHRLSSLVFESLEHIRPPNLPPSIHAKLQHRARHNAFEALRATNELRRITTIFTAAGIQVSVLKGVPLSYLLFGNPNSRHVGDIDILTQPTRLPEQIALLSQLGYEIVNPKSRLTPRRIAAYVQFWKDLTFQNRTTGFELDLHWRLFNNRLHPANRLAAQGQFQTVTVFAAPMRVFSLQDQFLYIAAHGIFDSFTYLKSLVDVAAFLRILTPQQIDHALLRARQLGLLAQVSAAIHLCNLWMGSEIASPHLLPADDPLARRIHHRTATLLLRQNFKPVRDFASPAQWLHLEIAIVPGLRSLAEIARRYLWRPRLWAAVDLPDRLFWCYPLLGLLTPPRRHTVEDDNPASKPSSTD